MVTACRSSCETTAQPKQSFPPTLAPSFLLSASLYLSVDILLNFFGPGENYFPGLWTFWKITKLYSSNMDAKAEKTNEKKKEKRNCPRPGTNTPPTVSEVLILSLMRSACVFPALITSADSLRIDMCRGSPSSRTQPVKVTVTGREVAVQSNYAADDGWVIGRDWQEGYGVELHCTAP